MRADNFSVSDLIAPGEQYWNVSAHIADASDAVSDKERQDDLAAAWEPVAESGVHVHVPQSGDEKLPVAVDDVRIFRQRRGGRARDESDSISVDYDDGVRLHRIGAGIDDGHIGDDALRRLKRSLCKSTRGNREHKRNKHHDAVKMEDHAAEDITALVGRAGPPDELR